MEKEIKIDIPQGMIVDVENSDFVNGVIKLKEKPHVQKKWEDFGEVKGYYITNASVICGYKQKSTSYNDKNTLPTKSLAEAMLALCQLLQWRNKVWKEDGNWMPNLNDNSTKHAIAFNVDKIDILYSNTSNRVLSFSSLKIAEQFLKDHRDLIETAKELL